MKRIKTYFLLLWLCAVCGSTQVAHATSLTDVVISKTPAKNTLVEHSATVGSMLPTGFTDAVFDASGNPTMDRVMLLMTMPADFSTISFDGTTIEGIGTIPGVDVVANGDYFFEFEADKANRRYVLSTTPIDPTERGVQTIYLQKSEKQKIYLTGSLTGTDSEGKNKRVSAELPAGLKLILPESLEPARALINKMFLQFINDIIDHPERQSDTMKGILTLIKRGGGLSLSENSEGFIYFEGDESSQLDLYIEDFAVQVQDKKLDFLGTMFGSQLSVNLLGFDQLMEAATNGAIYEAVNNELTAEDWDKVKALYTTKYAALEAAYKAANGGYPCFADGTCEADGTRTTETIGNEEMALIAKAYMEAIRELASSNTNIATALSNAVAQETTTEKNVTRMQEVIQYMAMSQISTRFSTVMSGDNNYEAMGKMFDGLIHGTASPIAFSSLSEKIEDESFQVNIHTKGESTLTGGAKSNFKNVTIFGMEGTGGDMYELCRIFESMVNFTAAPLAVRPSAKVGAVDDYAYTCARLTFDDLWTDGTHTNGLLNLPVDGHDLDAPSIDIGNPNGQAIFNSGRYKLHTAASNKNRSMFYVATMAICYRELSVTMPGAGNITYTGIGTSIGSGRSAYKQDKYQNVIINDGTFETYSAIAWTSLPTIADRVDVVANGWYNDYTDLRLPYNTSLYGGTFTNCYLYRCDAAAELGIEPVYGYTDRYGNVIEVTALCSRKPYAANTLDADYALGSGKPLEVDAIAVTNSLTFSAKAGGGSSTNWVYGHNSLTPAADGFVYLYVPEGDCSAETIYRRNYTTAMLPLGEHHVGVDMIKMGGSVHVDNRFQKLYDQTNAYLLYIRLNQYTFDSAHVEFVGGIKRTVEHEFRTIQEKEKYQNNPSADSARVYFADVTNEGEYVIQNGIYMMIPILSDQWMMFSPPFDVANVYVMQTIAEQPQKMRTSNNPYGWTNNDYHEYFLRQGIADGNMAQTLVTSVLPDIFSGKGSGVLKPLPEILTKMTNSDTKLTKLIHYDGSFASMKSAHYYLNEMKPDVEGTTLWNQEQNELAYGWKWQPAKKFRPEYIQADIPDDECDPLEYPDGCAGDDIQYTDQDGNQRPDDEQWCIMKKGNIYSMFFPGGATRWYDYKYLIIEGYGPQRLSGNKPTFEKYYGNSVKQTDESFVTILPDEGIIALQGNATFATDTLHNIAYTHPLFYAEKTSDGSFSLDLSGERPYCGFVAHYDSDQQIMPAQVYMVSSDANATKVNMPMLRHTADATTDLETVNPDLPRLFDLSLEAWADNGIMLRAYEEQKVSIYSVDGHLIWSGSLEAMQTKHVPASTGIYLIQGEETTVKLIVEQ